uniref:MBL fold metallo-hydrolase n=1 Tax=Eiseniibacteriota bacterium TaxID=2212470 RepID=A0A832I595_UNCEI
MATAPAWTDLGGGVFVRRSAAFRMNSVALLDRSHAVVIDPGVLPSELEDLAAAVGHGAPERVTLVFSHAHWDHVLGLPWFPGARTVAHDRFADALARDAGRIDAEARALCEAHGEAWPRTFAPFRPDEAVGGQRFLKLDPWRLVLRDAPGHCASQLTVHLPEEGVLFAADMLSDVEVPTLDAPLSHFRATLEGLRPLVEGGAIAHLVPGHGAIASGAEVAARFAYDLAYLERLEREVRAARERGLDAAGAAAAIAPWEGIERDPEFPMAEIHRDNVLHAFRGLDVPPPAAPAPRTGGDGRRAGGPRGVRAARRARPGAAPRAGPRRTGGGGGRGPDGGRHGGGAPRRRGR